VRVFNFENWLEQPSASTEAGHYYGIAIGSDSHESTVRANGALLQAGRALPLRSAGGAYTLQRERIPASVGNVGGIPAITRLQVFCYECESELAGAASCNRPDLETSITAAVPATGNPVIIQTVPFRGRRAALVVLTSGGFASVTYSIRGYRWSTALRAAKRVELKSEASVAFQPDGTYAFYIGGTDNAECWDALELAITQAVGTGQQTYTADIACIGEIGTR